MYSIKPGTDTTLVATLRDESGAPVPVADGSVVRLRFYDASGAVPLMAAVDGLPGHPRADWDLGVVAADFTAAQMDGIAGASAALVVSVAWAGETRKWRVWFAVDAAENRSALFPSRSAAIAKLRSGQLALAASLYSQLDKVSDDALWDALRAAEAHVARALTIPLEPTEIFPDPPTPAELDAIQGRPWRLEPGYDLPVDFFTQSVWGALKLRVRPIIDIHRIQMVYPNQGGVTFEIPVAWLRIAHKAGQIQVFPSAQVVSIPMSVFTLQAIGAGVTIPYMIRIRYTAGLENVERDYPDVLKLVLRSAVLSVLRDSFQPQSASISADGFSKSLSADIAKMGEDIEAQAAQLREQLLGPIWGVF